MRKVVLIVAVILTYLIVKRGLAYVVERQDPLTDSELRHILKAKQEWDADPHQTLHSTEDVETALEKMWAEDEP